jgi:predicted peptidase
MRILVIALVFILLLTSRPASAEVEGTLARNLKSDPKQKYYLYLPKNFDPAHQYPLFIAIPWYKGTAQEQIENWHNFTNRDQYILLSPQFKDGYQELRHKEDRTLVRIMDEVAEEFNFDLNSVYLEGCSGGGQFAHRFVFKYPELIKAASIIAAGSYSSPPNNPAATRVKFFVGVGEKDSERLTITQQFYQELLDKGYDVQFKIFPGIGHSCGIDTQAAVMDYLKNLN